MKNSKNPCKVPLPNSWPRRVRSAMLHVISLASFAGTAARGWAVNSPIVRRRLQSENERLRQEVALLVEELRIKHARMERLLPQKRPHYGPTERMSILELRTARAWSTMQTADVFHVTPVTIATWMKRLEEEGQNALVQIKEPVNKFPDFVRYAVQRLKTLCPNLGRPKIAEILCRAGLHLGATTVGRILKEPPRAAPHEETESANRMVTAKRVNHVWHVDLTAVPMEGFWTPWLPFTLPQRWPFCWWLAVFVDHYSRRAQGFAVLAERPTSDDIRSFLGQVTARVGATPRHLICDKEKIFWCTGFKSWCRRKGIHPRYGAAGQHGSIAVVERFIRSMKDEGLRRIPVAHSQTLFSRDVAAYVTWYNEHRPHATLGGQTPDEVYLRLRPANRRPRIEPRKHWPRSAPCAQPVVLVAGQPGDRFTVEVDFHDGKRHLPIVSLRRAA